MRSFITSVIWSLVTDDFLEMVTSEGARVDGFADDFVISIRGKFGSVVSIE